MGLFSINALSEEVKRVTLALDTDGYSGRMIPIQAPWEIQHGRMFINL